MKRRWKLILVVETNYEGYQELLVGRYWLHASALMDKWFAEAGVSNDDRMHYEIRRS